MIPIFTYTVPTEAEYDLEQGFSTGDDLPPGEHVAMSGDICGCHSWGHATGIQWMDAANHPTVEKTAATENRLTQNISDAEVWETPT